MLKLNLPAYDYLVKKQNDALYIYDMVRKKYVLLTPEEWVRQHFLNYLITSFSIPAYLISVEILVKYNKLSKRADILVYSNNGQPLLLVECKSPTVKLSSDTLLQISSYNKDIKVPLLAITNGMENFFWKWNEKKGSYESSDLPTDFTEMTRL